MQRKPIVAGQFYPGDVDALLSTVGTFLSVTARDRERTLVAMAPHAGYPYSGAVAGAALGQANLSKRCVLLGPNHTGAGAALAVWPSGTWLVPGGGLRVDAELAARILETVPGAEADTLAHLREHSLEVLCPFLMALDRTISIVPVSVALRSAEALYAAGRELGRLLAREAAPVSIVVSSDMSHYVSADTARRQDGLALARIEALDGPGLLETVVRQGISMCGVLPMAMGLVAAKEMGATRARITGYATSGDTTGDLSSVVGYAGAIVS